MVMRSIEKPPILLTDEQIREFIVDGYVVFKPDLPDSVHERIRQKLHDVFANEVNPGNNILPRVPEMDAVLNSPEVRGALISVLGEGYFEHPHRFCHYTGPLAEGSKRKRTLAENCHQDSYTPLGRPRKHYPRYARIMYYPQDTPVKMGPTYVIPGTQYHKVLSDADRSRTIPIAGLAGTVSITHFDVAHAAGINEANRHRHMIKFIYVRDKAPEKPSWDCRSTNWQKPAEVKTCYDLQLLWSHIWDWMCGKSDRYESADDNLPGNEALPALVACLNSDCPETRLNAIYALGSIGSPAVAPLADALRTSGNQEDATSKGWNEGAVAMDDAAFAPTAAGVHAVPALLALLQDSSEWVRINAAFALGELNSAAADAVPALLRCLNDRSHQVVRTATDALGSIRERGAMFIPELGRLLSVERPDWSEELRRGWTAKDQVRTNSAMAFCRLGTAAATYEDVLIEALDDPCGHVAAFALLALERIGSPEAMAAVLSYLKSRRWDESITQARLF